MTAPEQARMLRTAGFPDGCKAVGVSPILRRVYPAALRFLLRRGCHLILAYGWRKPPIYVGAGEAIPHSVVCDGYRAEGFTILNSGGGHAEESLVEFEPMPTVADHYFLEAMREKYQQGSRQILPFGPVAREAEDVGVDLWFVMALPPRPEVAEVAAYYLKRRKCGTQEVGVGRAFSSRLEAVSFGDGRHSAPQSAGAIACGLSLKNRCRFHYHA